MLVSSRSGQISQKFVNKVFDVTCFENNRLRYISN